MKPYSPARAKSGPNFQIGRPRTALGQGAYHGAALARDGAKLDMFCFPFRTRLGLGAGLSEFILRATGRLASDCSCRSSPIQSRARALSAASPWDIIGNALRCSSVRQVRLRPSLRCLRRVELLLARVSETTPGWVLLCSAAFVAAGRRAQGLQAASLLHRHVTILNSGRHTALLV